MRCDDCRIIHSYSSFPSLVFLIIGVVFRPLLRATQLFASVLIQWLDIVETTIKQGRAFIFPCYVDVRMVTNWSRKLAEMFYCAFQQTEIPFEYKNVANISLREPVLGLFYIKSDTPLCEIKFFFCNTKFWT